MIPLTLQEIAAVVGGEVHGDPDTVVSSPAFVDSRTPVAAGLFVAVPGERVDGHEFAADAMAAGAAGVLGSRPVDAPCVVVGDTLVALGVLAAHVLARLPECRVIGLTGSQGKTTTKDLVAQLLEDYGPTVAPRASLNNELGVPLTALAADATTRCLVIEMGARGIGQIAYLAQLVRPSIGAVLNVGVAHLGEFGSRAGIAQAKGELVESLPATGLAVLNADDDLVSAMRDRTRAQVLTFGRTEAAHVRVSDLELDGRGRPRFTLTMPDGTATVALPLIGAHQADNAAAAAAIAHGVGMPVARIAAALGRAEPRSPWRLEVRERADGLTVVNDAYNANPDSMRAALDTLLTVGEGRRTVAVLGEMHELGAASRDEHRALGKLAVRLGVGHLVTVGDGAVAIHEAAVGVGSHRDEAVHAPDVDAAIRHLRRVVDAGDVVLVKASRAEGLERVAEALLADAGGEEVGA